MTSVIKNAPGTIGYAQDVTMYPYNQGEFLHRSTEKLPGGSSSVYVYTAGDSDVETLLTISSQVDAKNIRRVSIRISTVNVELDANDVEVARTPVDVVVALNFFSPAEIVNAELWRLTSGAFGVLFGVFATNTSGAEAIAALVRGITESYPWDPAA